MPAARQVMADMRETHTSLTGPRAGYDLLEMGADFKKTQGRLEALPGADLVSQGIKDLGQGQE